MINGKFNIQEWVNNEGIESKFIKYLTNDTNNNLRIMSMINIMDSYYDDRTEEYIQPIENDVSYNKYVRFWNNYYDNINEYVLKRYIYLCCIADSDTVDKRNYYSDKLKKLDDEFVNFNEITKNKFYIDLN